MTVWKPHRSATSSIVRLEIGFKRATSGDMR